MLERLPKVGVRGTCVERAWGCGGKQVYAGARAEREGCRAVPEVPVCIVAYVRLRLTKDFTIRRVSSPNFG